MVAFGNDPLFQLGRVVATPAALKALEEAKIAPQSLLRRHEHGDWGEADKQANEAGLKDGSRLLSVYKLPSGETIWIMTEAAGDNGLRASTCIMLPDEY